MTDGQNISQQTKPEGHDDGIDDEEEDYGDRFEYEPNTTVAFERDMDSLALNVGELQDTLDL